MTSSIHGFPRREKKMDDFEWNNIFIQSNGLRWRKELHVALRQGATFVPQWEQVKLNSPFIILF